MKFSAKIVFGYFFFILPLVRNHDVALGGNEPSAQLPAVNVHPAAHGLDTALNGFILSNAAVDVILYILPPFFFPQFF